MMHTREGDLIWSSRATEEPRSPSVRMVNPKVLGLDNSQVKILSVFSLCKRLGTVCICLPAHQYKDRKPSGALPPDYLQHSKSISAKTTKLVSIGGNRCTFCRESQCRHDHLGSFVVCDAPSWMQVSWFSRRRATQALKDNALSDAHLPIAFIVLVQRDRESVLQCLERQGCSTGAAQVSRGLWTGGEKDEA